MLKSVALGVDIGGTHISAALIDIAERSLINGSLKRLAVNSRADKASILSAWCNIINDAFDGVPLQNRMVGIAMPGPFDYAAGISLINEQDKFKSLYQINIKNELASCLNIPTEHIHFINDAAGFLQGEVYAGAAKGKQNVLGLTLGTGLGSAICMGGEATDADLWNSPFMDGIAEDYLSTRWFVQRYAQLSGQKLDGVKELADLAASNHDATRVFMEFGYNLAQFLIPIIKKNKIDMVIFGGNITQAFDAFAPELTAILRGNDIHADVKISTLKEHAALIGAASCCDSFKEKQV